jgi:glycerol-3-phosphate acyltransferase PlsY
VTLLLAVVAGYLLGAVSPATLLARRAGADLRASGSGNPGATNVGRLLGPRAGVLVAVLDVLKGLLPAAAFGLLAHEAGLLAGLAAMLGHVTSPFLRGRGGKGVATAAGAVLGSHPAWAPLVLLVWLVVTGLSRWVALGSVAAVAGLVVCAVAFRAPGADVAWAAAIALVVLTRHRRNFFSTDRSRARREADPAP